MVTERLKWPVCITLIQSYMYVMIELNANEVNTPDRRQSKTLLIIDERGSKIARNSVFDCHLSPDWRKMAIENTGSSAFDLHSSRVLMFPIAAYPLWKMLNQL